MIKVITHDNIDYEIEYHYEDTSFAHAFGFKIQGHYEIDRVSIAGFDVTEVLKDSIIEKLEDQLND